MRSLTLLILACLFTTSCRYQYFSYNSSLTKNTEHQFYDERDSISVNYEFVSNGVLKIKIKNNTKRDIYLDLKKSKIMVGNDTITFHEDDSTKGPKLLSEQSIESIIQANKEKTIRFRSLNNDFEKFGFEEYERFKIGKRKARKYTFNQASSIKSFTCQIVANINENLEPKIFHHQFWVDELVQTRLNKDYPLPTNEIKTEAMTASGTILQTAVSLPVGIVGIIVWVTLNCEDC